MMKFYRKLLALFTIGVMVSMLNFSDATIPGGQPYTPINNNSDAKVGDESELNIEHGINFTDDSLEGLIKYKEKSDYKSSMNDAWDLIEIAVNWILGIMSFVALLFVLYNGFLVLSAGSNDKNSEKGKNGLKTAAIALIGLGLSRLIISAMIWFIKLITES